MYGLDPAIRARTTAGRWPARRPAMTGGVAPDRGFILEGAASPVATHSNHPRCVSISGGWYECRPRWREAGQKKDSDANRRKKAQMLRAASAIPRNLARRSLPPAGRSARYICAFLRLFAFICV